MVILIGLIDNATSRLEAALSQLLSQLQQVLDVDTNNYRHHYNNNHSLCHRLFNNSTSNKSRNSTNSIYDNNHHRRNHHHHHKTLQRARLCFLGATILLFSIVCRVILQSVLPSGRILHDDEASLLIGLAEATTADATTTTTTTESQLTTSRIKVSKVYPEIFRKTEGDGWTIWHDSDTPLLQRRIITTKPQSQQQLTSPSSSNSTDTDDDWTCHWARFRPFIRGANNNNNHHDNDENNSHKKYSGPPVQVCTHDPFKEDIWVSKALRMEGRWRDCDSLTYWYHESKQGNRHDKEPQKFNTYSATTTGASEQHDGWYVDIGANLGSCVMQVLLTTNASIVALEPDPRNLFHLTSTLSQLPVSLRKRVYVVPVALGDKPGMSHIHVATDNRGNAVVGQEVKDRKSPDQTFLPAVPIPVERLDDLLHIGVVDNNNNQIDSPSHHHPHRLLVKMDAQGYECNIVRGMPQLLQAASTVVFELEVTMLRSFPNCSEQVLWDAFAGSNIGGGGGGGAGGGEWEIYNDQLVASGLPRPLASIRNVPTARDGINLVARKKK